MLVFTISFTTFAFTRRLRWIKQHIFYFQFYGKILLFLVLLCYVTMLTLTKKVIIYDFCFKEKQFGQKTIWSKYNLVKRQFGQNIIWSKYNLVKIQFGQNTIWSKDNLVKRQKWLKGKWSIFFFNQVFVFDRNWRNVN